MHRIIALLLLFACGAASAMDVALIGVFANKAAVFAVDGGEPKAVKVGQSWNGILVLSVGRDRATVEIDGKKRVLIQGQHYRSNAVSTDRQRMTLAADSRGHFIVDGAINGNATRFLVDTGATSVVLPAADAKRMGIDYLKGEPGFANTAAGVVPVYNVKLDTVKLGTIELSAVDGTVVERGLAITLLGMSFLNRVEMQRDGQTMTLIRRF